MTSDEYRAKSRRPFRLLAFRYAFQGLRVLVTTQPNARVHLGATVAALLVAAFLGLSRWEWMALTFAIILVWTVEALNTALEFLVDLVSPEPHMLAGWAKDVAAAAVLVTSLGAVIVGVLVFWPHLLALGASWASR